MSDELEIGQEGPNRFTVAWDGRPGRQCGWLWRVAVDRYLWCVRERGHDGEHEYRAASA